LSGFTLTYGYAGRSEAELFIVRGHEFPKSRLARIYPTYFLELCISLPIFVYGTFVWKIQSLGVFVGGLMLSPLLLQAWAPAMAVAWNVPSWSLSVEWFFYLCFPALTHQVQRLRCKQLVVLAYSFVVAMALLRALPNPLPPSGSFSVSPETWHNFISYFPFFHLPQFVFGVALGRLYLFGQLHLGTAQSSIFGSAVIGLLLIFGLRSSLPLWVQTDPVLVLLYGAVIYGGAGIEGGVRRVLTVPPIILLGKASYSIYILHIPLLFWWSWITRKMLSSPLPVLADFMLYFGLVITASILSFRYVEQPWRWRIVNL